MSKGSIRDRLKPRKTATQIILTHEKWEELQSVWEQKAADLLARDGGDPKYPEHFIKHNPKLLAVIQSSFEGFIERFVERQYSHPEPKARHKTDYIKHLSAKEYERWAVTRFAKVTFDRINEITEDREVSKQITGSIVRRSAATFNQVFPNMKPAYVFYDALDGWKKYLQPKGESRYR